MLGALLLLAAGCSVVQGTVSTVRALSGGGFGSPQIQLDPGDAVRVTVVKDTEDLDGAAAEAAGLVWAKLPLRVERLDVTCKNGFGGRAIFRADRAELERRFGSRDPALDEALQRIDSRSVVLVAGAVLLGGLLVLGGIIVLIVVVVRRNRKRLPPPGPPGPPSGWDPQPPPPRYLP